MTRLQTLILLTVLSYLLPAQAQWDFDLVDNGITTNSVSMTLPMTYSEADCELTFTAVDNGQVTNAVISNPLGCGLPHVLVMDGYVYDLPNSFELTMSIDQHLITGLVSTGSCSRLSLLPITAGPPDLFFNGTSIKLGTNNDQFIYTRNGVTYLQFNTLDSDVFCDNGIPFVHPDDLIYRAEFE